MRGYESTHLPNLSIALGEPFTELEAVNGKLKIVESNYSKKTKLFNKLSCVMASEGVLVVKSLEDIAVVHDLQKSFRCNGRVKLVRGRPDHIEKCLDLIGKYKIRRTDD